MKKYNCKNSVPKSTQELDKTLCLNLKTSDKENANKKVAVIFGGYSSEYQVSLKSAYAVLSNLDHKKYDVIPIGITQQGEWYRYYGKYDRLLNDTWSNQQSDLTSVVISQSRNVHGIIEFINNIAIFNRIDLAFPILHGKNGEDGTIQGVFEIAGIPVIGCGVLSSALCMDKDRAHKLVQTAGVKVPKSFVITKDFNISEITQKANTMGGSVFVKPLKAGSSYGITKVENMSELDKAIETALIYDNKVIIEENICGFEVGCAVLGNDRQLIIGEVDEIDLSCGFFNFVEKYTLKNSEIHIPARIKPEISDKIKETAKIIYNALDCKGFARVDMFLSETGEIVFNEVNTIPGFTEHSRYPNMMKYIGISFDEILNKLIDLSSE
ncbi:MAG: D-alanine--D-serine ligase VanG [Clostridia bacterium]|nr:D-alanine--D-serine ligase VanG [Clostridia bacterium]